MDVSLCICCRRVEEKGTDDAESVVDRRLMCMWHVGLHYLLPFSHVMAEAHHRRVLSQDIAGIPAYYWAHSMGP